MRRLFAIAALLAAPAGLALPEDELEALYADWLLPLETEGVGTLAGNDGATLAYRAHEGDGDRGLVVLLPGYTESHVKYVEVTADLAAEGFDVFVLDHRGMGQSSRLAPNPQVVHVERFDDYVDDAARFVREVVLPRAEGRPLWLLAHSTGGLVAAKLLAREPELFRAAVLSAPLFEVHTGTLPEWLAYLAVSFHTLRGAGAAYAPGSRDRDPETGDAAESRTTTSAVRHAMQLGQLRRRPELRMSGPSNQWVREAIRATREREALGARIATPLLVLQANEDFYAKPAGQAAFCAAAPRCELVPYPGTRHELLMERDPTRNDVLRRILAHFDR